MSWVKLRQMKHKHKDQHSLRAARISLLKSKAGYQQHSQPKKCGSVKGDGIGRDELNRAMQATQAFEAKFPGRPLLIDNLENYFHPGGLSRLEKEILGMLEDPESTQDQSEARDQSEADAATIVPPEIRPVCPPARRGPKLQVEGAQQVRVPTTEYLKDALLALARGEFTPTEGNGGVFAVLGDTQIRIDCDDTAGFDALTLVKMLSAYGPATMQTYLALIGLWVENNSGATHETYFTARASDLMRYMHRRETGKGGYNVEDQKQKGREVWILSRTTVPYAIFTRFPNGKKTVETISLDQLIHLQTLTAVRTLEDGKEVQSILEFRYHPNRQMYEMLCGDTPQFAQISGKLLSYHPVREKYKIILGIALAFYDRVNRKHNREMHTISLAALLRLAGIEVPKSNLARFVKQIECAIDKLGKDGLFPGAVLNMPESSALSMRQKFSAAEVSFPPVSYSSSASLPNTASPS